MKLSVRFAVLVTVTFLVSIGFVWWLLANRLGAANRSVASLSVQLAEQTQKERELKTRLSSVAANQGATDIATRAAAALSAFVGERTAELKNSDVLAEFLGAADEQAAAAAKMLGAAKALDQVIMTDTAGVVVLVAPANASLLGQPYLTAKEVAACRKLTEPRLVVKVSEKTPARLLAAMMPVRAQVGTRQTFVGVVVEVAAFENILKGVAGSVAGETETRFLFVDKAGEIAFAPTPDLLGKAVKDLPELKVLMDAADGQVVEANHDLRRWMAVRSPGPLGMIVIGLGAISAPPAGGTAGSAAAPGIPFLILGLVAIAGLAGILVIVLLPLGRLGALAKLAESLASGATSVEFKSAGANDEIGATARALEKVAEQLEGERHHRDETATAYATLQRDLQRVQTEGRELQEYQRNLEAKSRQQQAALEGEVAAARQELETARAEIETIRNELNTQQAAVAAQSAAVVARDAAIVERDAALVQAGQQIQSLTESLAALQQSVESLSGRLAESNAEVDRRKSAPAAAFGLFSEASEALSVELAGLIELVQGYISQLVEAGAITEEQQQFLSTVITRSARSQRLMGDLRDFSNIVRPDGLAREPIDFSVLLTDVFGSAQEGAEARGITLDAEVPPLPETMGDEARLRQLFTVLLQNAIRFTPEGGTVSVRIGVREGVAGIRIEDGAESIPVKSDEVFDHFHPTDEEIMELRGSGLRFPILRAIASAHGGAIDLAITEQGSNLFFVRIPVRSEAPTADQTAALFAGVTTGETGPASAAVVAPVAQPEQPPAEVSPDTSAFAAAFAAFAGSSAAAPETASLEAVPAPAEPATADASAFAAEFAAFAAAPAPEAPSLEAAPSVPAAESAVDASAFAAEFAAFAAAPAPESPSPAAPFGTETPAEAPPAMDLSSVLSSFDAPAPAAPAPGVETTDSIMAAPAETPGVPAGLGVEDLWTVPDAGAPPTVDSIEAAAADGGTPPPAPPAAPPEGEPPKPFSFGSDEILTE